MKGDSIMPYIVNEVKDYKITFYGTSSHAYKDCRASITLYGPGNKCGIVGRISFFPSDIVKKRQDNLVMTIKEPKEYIPQGYMPDTVIGSVIDMLRNEKPIYIHWSDYRKNVYLSTSTEPVGEEETVK